MTLTLEKVGKELDHLKKRVHELEAQIKIERKSASRSIEKREDKALLALSQPSFNEVWDNEKDEKTWKKYL